MKNEMPVFIYSMVPLQTTAYKNLFEAGPLKSLLENPGQLRYADGTLQRIATHKSSKATISN